MSRLGDFAAFQAAVHILKDKGQESLLDELYLKAKAEIIKPAEEQRNIIQDLYAGMSDAEISLKVGEMVRPADLNAELEIVYQSVENLHKASPKHEGDWYFTGNYPTPGGTKVANRSFLYFMEGRKERAY
jgi:amidophosphoribosyltransferase